MRLGVLFVRYLYLRATPPAGWGSWTDGDCFAGLPERKMVGVGHSIDLDKTRLARRRGFRIPLWTVQG